MHITNRYQASATHLAVSAIIALLSAVLVFVVWYPAPLASISGVTGIFLIVLAVDVVLGPFITLVVFNRAKRELKRDLVIVLALQLAALAYGLHTVYSARPAYLVFSADRFDVVFANELTDEKLAKVTDPRYRSAPILGPETIAARRPSGGKERADIMFGAVQGGDDVAQLPQYYEPLENQKAKIIERLLPLDQLKVFNTAQIGEVEALIRRHANVAGGVGFVPVRGKVSDGTAVISRASGTVLDIVDLKPWS